MTEFRDKLLEMQGKLRSYAIKLTRNTHRAEDLVSDTNIRALSYEHRYTEQGNFEGWVYHILRNVFFSAGRRSKCDERLYLKHQHESEAIPPGQDEAVFLSEMDKALKKISREQRKLILDMIVNGHSYEEMSKHLGVSIGTVKSRIWRAKAALAKAYYGCDAETSGESDKVKVIEPPPAEPIIILIPKRKTGRPVDPNSARQRRLRKAEMLERLRAMGRAVSGYRAGTRQKSVTIK